MSDHCNSCFSESDDLVGITKPEVFKLGRAALVLCEGCGMTQVDPGGYCLGGCKGDYFTKQEHLCRYCLFQDTPAERERCPFHNISLWQEFLNDVEYIWRKYVRHVRHSL